MIIDLWQIVVGTCVILGGGAAAVKIVSGIREIRKKKPTAIPEYLALLDNYKAELISRIQSEYKLGIALEEVARLRSELQAIESRDLQAKGLPAHPPKGALESAEQKQDRAAIEQRLVDIVDHFKLGFESSILEDWPSAQKHYEAALAEERTIAVLNNLANVYQRLFRFADALNLFDEAEAQLRAQGLPEDAALVKNRGVVYGSLRRYEDELASYDKAEQLRQEQGLPEDSDLAINRGVVYRNLGRYEEALASYKKAEQLRQEQGLPEDSDLATNRGVVYGSLERYEEALEAFTKAEELRRERGLPEEGALTMNRGVAYKHLRRYAEALAAYDRAEQIRRDQGLPVDPSITFNRALVYSAQGDLTTACQLACQARDMYKEHHLQVPVHPNILKFIEEHCSGGE